MEDARQSDSAAVTPGATASGTDAPLRVRLQEAGRWWPQGEHAGEQPTWVVDDAAMPEGWTRSGLRLDLVHPKLDGVVPWRTADGLAVEAFLSGPHPRPGGGHTWSLQLTHAPERTHAFAGAVPPSAADRAAVLQEWGYRPLPLNDGSPAGWDWTELPDELGGGMAGTLPLVPGASA